MRNQRNCYCEQPQAVVKPRLVLRVRHWLASVRRQQVMTAAALMLVVLLHASPAEPGLQPVLPLDMRSPPKNVYSKLYSQP